MKERRSIGQMPTSCIGAGEQNECCKCPKIMWWHENNYFDAESRPGRKLWNVKSGAEARRLH